MKQIILVAVLAVLLVGCGTMVGTGIVKTGMTKQEVLETLGPPVTLTTKDGDPAEYLHYPSDLIQTASENDSPTYSIAIVNGRVDAHGVSAHLGITDTGF